MKNLWIPIVIYLSKKQKKLPPPLSEKKKEIVTTKFARLSFDSEWVIWWTGK